MFAHLHQVGYELYLKHRFPPSMFPFLFSFQTEVGRCSCALWSDGNKRNNVSGKRRSTETTLLHLRPGGSGVGDCQLSPTQLRPSTRQEQGLHAQWRGLEVGWWGREESTETASIFCCSVEEHQVSAHSWECRVQDQCTERGYFTKLFK